jgi:hypothetical protein
MPTKRADVFKIRAALRDEVMEFLISCVRDESLKPSDRIKSAELAGKALGLFDQTRIEAEGKRALLHEQGDVRRLSDAEIDALLAESAEQRALPAGCGGDQDVMIIDAVR